MTTGSSLSSSPSWNDVIVSEYSREPRLQGIFPKVVREYRVTSDSTITIPTTSRNNLHHQTLSKWIQFHFWEIPTRVAKDLFLPVGYPDSVEKSYFAYQVYDSLQGLCSYLRGVVSTSAVLKAAGVGDATATAMSAAMTWAMRDGVGMVGGLCFSYVAAPLFDANIKEWRLFADVINDVGLTLDMLAPIWGTRWFLVVSSFSTLCKVMCGISAGATKGSITQHFSRRGNVADLNAKESTQETLVSLVGMVLGVALARFLHRLEDAGSRDLAFSFSWSVFVILTVLHVVANYAGVKILKLRTLNRERAICALQGVIDTIANDCQEATTTKDPPINLILPPDHVSESLFQSFLNIFYYGKVVLGARLPFLFRGLVPKDLLFYFDEFGGENYLITLVGDKVAATLRVGATETDTIKAFVHAMVVHRCISVRSQHGPSNHDIVQRSHVNISHLFGESGRDESPNNKLSLATLANRGWDVESCLNLGFGSTRVQWYGTKSE